MSLNDQMPHEDQQLRKTLAIAFPNKRDAKLLASDAGLKESEIDFEGTPEAVWWAILEVAGRQEKILALLACVAERASKWKSLWDDRMIRYNEQRRGRADYDRLGSDSQVLSFQDRWRELDEICTCRTNVLNFYGEAGIGKTRLLNEAAHALRRRNHNALVLRVDLAALPQQQEGRPLGLLNRLAEQAPELGPVAGEAGAAAEQMAKRLNSIAADRRVTLMFDTTDDLQDPTFWHWFEKSFISPLAVGGSVQVSLTGRLPAPIRLVQVRRHLKVWPLEPLPVDHEARALVREALEMEARSGSAPEVQGTHWLSPVKVEEFTALTLEFSCGHPLLSKRIACYLARAADQESIPALRIRIAKEVVGPFIDKDLLPFEADMAHWRPILMRACALDWFDSSVLYRLCVGVDRFLMDMLETEWECEFVMETPAIEWEYEFFKAIPRLRSPYAVVEWQGMGYTLVSAIKRIVAKYMQVARRTEYIGALDVAAEVFNGLADEFFADDPQAAEPYRQAARTYSTRRAKVQYAATEQPPS
jgi:hypothetical protein